MIVIGAVLGLVLIWFLVLTTLSSLGGWAGVARSFPAKGVPKGTTYYMQSGRFGWCDYNGVLTIRVSDEGLGISVLPPFRPGHPPMFVPWSAMHVIEVFDRWYGRTVTVEVGSPVLAKVRLPLKIMDAAKLAKPSDVSQV